MSKIVLVNPSNTSPGYSFITPRWLFVLAGATSYTVLAAALVGALYYGLAGINHCFHENRNRLQNLALASDLFAAAVLVICCFA